MNIQSILSAGAIDAFKKAGISEEFDPVVKPASKKQFGDYQINGIMSIAKKIGLPPRELAERVVPHLTFNPMISRVEVAGPGFINIFLSSNWLAAQAETSLAHPTLNITAPTKQTIVVDYSAPNVAKEMHVGHIRSTVIGDAMVRTLEFLGHHVIRANHLGDWGTQFGMLIAYLEELQRSQGENELSISDLESFYRAAKARYDTDETFAIQARQYVVRLQSGDSYCLSMWRKLVDITLKQNQLTYTRLGISLTEKDIMGESLYNPMLPNIVNDLMLKGLAVKDNGAVVVYLDEYKNKEGQPMGVIIQKQDGGFLYTTTDIACAKYRYEQLHADRVLYYIDSRQHQHLMQAWSIVRKAGYVPERVSLEHHMFGMMLDKTGKPFKTRSGGTIKLMDLLDEAIERATQLVAHKNTQLNAEENQAVIQALAIGAVKYADLSKNRTTDYIFDWDTMLSFEGNTAPYLQYAYTRIQSIFKRGAIDPSTLSGKIDLNDQYEIALVTRVLQLEETLYHVAREGLPHLLCSFLFEVAGLFSSFYEHCPILNNPDPNLQQSRLNISWLTAKTLKTGLSLLGIETVDKM